jgi:hypothetical protein
MIAPAVLMAWFISRVWFYYLLEGCDATWTSEKDPE